MANESLSKAKSKKNDEFYTVFDYIQKEMNAYLEYDPNVFRGKTVLLPCDDPAWSNFTRYFAQNFETHGLKKLISTGYATESKEQQYEQYHQIYDCRLGGTVCEITVEIRKRSGREFGF